MIGKKIEELRRYRGETQAEFAASIGKGASHVSGIEREDNDPSVALLCEIIRVKKVDARWFFGQLEKIEDADISRSKPATTEGIYEKIQAIESKMAISESFDPLAYSVKVKPELRDIVRILKDYDSMTLREILGVVSGYLIKLTRESDNINMEASGQTGTHDK